MICYAIWVVKKVISICREKYVVFLLFLTTLFYLLMYLSSWWPLRIQNVGGGHSYEDLKFVFQYADCNFGNIEVSLKDCPLPSYQYGMILLEILRYMSITQLPLAFIGALLITLVILAFYKIINIAQPKTFLVFIYIASPALWLLFERGNIDSLIFILLFLAALTLSTRFEIIGVFLIALSALVKFYTLPILLIVPFIIKNKIVKITSVLFFLALVPMVFINMRAIEAFPFPMFTAFGSPAPGLWLNFFSWRFNLGLKLSDLESHFIGIFLYSITTLLLLTNKSLQNKIGLKALNVVNNRTNILCTVFTSTYLITYLAGMNFDYRLVYLIASLILYSKINSELFRNKIFQILAISSLWMTYFFFGFTGAVPVIFMIIGNISQGLIASILTCEIIFRSQLYRKLIHSF